MQTTLLQLALLFSLLIGQSAIVIAQDSTQVNIDSLGSEKEVIIENIVPEYVVYKGDSLFEIKANLGPYSPLERAEAINERINLLKQKNKSIEVDSFQLR